MSLTPEELTRYSRHLILPEIGPEGQEKLVQSKVLVIGTGGLGSPVCMYLSASGIGTIGIADFDKVDLSNLQRQIIHGTENVGLPKVESARRRLFSINPHSHVIPYETQVNSHNIMELIETYDLVIDGSDNFPTRYLVNDACILMKKPLIYGAIYRFEGHASVFYPGRGPCYRCLYPEPPDPKDVPNCSQVGVLGVLPGIIGLIQVTECIKLILGIGQPLIGRLLLFDALPMKFREIKIPKQNTCALCGDHPTINRPIEYDVVCTEHFLPQDHPYENLPEDISPHQLKQILEDKKPVILLDIREISEWKFNHLPDTVHIPLGELQSKLNTLDKTKEYVVYCHSGIRSRYALEMLKQNGFSKVSNLAGGIENWALQIDPTMPRY